MVCDMRTAVPDTYEVLTAIRAEMAAQRVTQRGLAEALGLKHPSVNRKLAGEQAMTVGELLTICERLHIPPSRLMFEAENRAAHRAGVA